jgi:hypothetical protein
MISEKKEKKKKMIVSLFKVMKFMLIYLMSLLIFEEKLYYNLIKRSNMSFSHILIFFSSFVLSVRHSNKVHENVWLPRIN